MPGWSNLQRMIDEARHDRDNPEVPSRSSQMQLLDGLFNFFQPVYDVFDQLHTAEVRLMGQGAMSRVIQSGKSFRDMARQQDASPYIQLQLNSTTMLTITVAIRRGLRYPEVIERAKWRCRVVAGTEELEVRLVDNRDEVARWIISTVMQYEVAEPEPTHRPEDPDRPRERVEEEPVAPPTREHRVIMLDEINEETR